MCSYDPWQAVAEYDHARVVVGDLREPLRGRIDFETQTITLQRRLTPTEQRCTLAHELVHLERGPVMMFQAPREERIVGAIAARRLVPLRALADALQWSTDERAIADELDVDVRTVRIRLRTLTEPERVFVSSQVRADLDV